MNTNGVILIRVWRNYLGRPKQYSGIFRATRKYIADTSSSGPRNVCVFLEFSQIILQNKPCVVVWDYMNFMLKKYCFGENALILTLFKQTTNINEMIAGGSSV